MHPATLSVISSFGTTRKVQGALSYVHSASDTAKTQSPEALKASQEAVATLAKALEGRRQALGNTDEATVCFRSPSASATSHTIPLHQLTPSTNTPSFPPPLPFPSPPRPGDCS